MLGKFFHKLGAMTGDGDDVDPSRFGDPIAQQTGWEPAKRGGASFCTHELARIDTHRAEFRPTIGAKAFYMAFLAMGAVLTTVFLSSLLSAGGPLTLEALIPVFVGIIFGVVGGTMFYFGTIPIVLDKSVGFFWKGRKNPAAFPGAIGTEDATPLEQIHSLQLISEHCRGNKSSYYSYELNLVLRDGRRVNVVDHGNLDRIRRDARSLATFLQKPLWDAA